MIDRGMDADDRLKNFEARLAALKQKVERGLHDRARILRELADRLEGGDESARRAIKTESHKLRGVAGTYGHHQLTEYAGQLEQRASVSPPATVGRMARELAELALSAGAAGQPQAALEPPSAEARGQSSARAKTISERPQLRAGHGGPLRVLAMDDDPVTQRLLQLTLREVGGFQAEIVDNAARALELLSESEFDIVVSDAMMPDMNGKEFYHAARAAGASMPIVILSAASPDELGWVKELKGSAAWLRKPFKPTQLVQDIARIYQAHQR